jgi:glycosyltransferase involved in cell wall biosynthesis
MEITVSIVTGTYNRLKNLKRMIDTLRFSVGVGFPYEIVIVDGGSTDGTIEWCLSQTDIVLIQQGKLLGAVKAFNEGFCTARGKYVIAGNDDITFVDESIQRAVIYMEEHADVGIGCFYQDRDGRDWHVDRMPAIIDGKQSNTWYGQVCIVRKWLGDAVGWWGDMYHTYAGDNELSCNVLEQGYKVEPVPCAAIHDMKHADGLRKINNEDRLVNGKHPDSEAWVKKWTRKGMLGPVVSDTKQIRPHEYELEYTRNKRIIYAPIYEQWSRIQKTTKRGLREALTHAGYLVSEVDYLKDPLYLFDMAEAIKPDMFLLQLHDTNVYNYNVIRDLRGMYPKAKFFNWNGDYFPENFLAEGYMRMMGLFDACGFVTTVNKEAYQKRGINWCYWQIGYEESTALPDRSTPRHDVLFLGNGHYDFRVELGKTLKAIPGVDVGIYGKWRELRANGENLYDYDAGQKLYGACKIAVSDSRPDAKGFVSNRIFQAMYAGAFTLQQRFEGIEELLDFRDKHHLVIYDKTSDLPELIRYYLKHEAERKIIAANGRKEVIEKHSFDNRVEELFTRYIRL